MLGVFESIDKLGNRLVIVLMGLPCIWSKCSFCPFALEQGNLQKVLPVNREIVERATDKLRTSDYSRISIFNGGSFYELPLDTVVRLHSLTRDRIVDIESRPEYLDFNTVVNTKFMLGSRKLVIRIGFEVYDERIRNAVLRKGIPQSEIFRLSLLREKLRNSGYNIEFLVYVLFGIEDIPENKVRESIEMFKRLFDGVIAVRYKRFLASHPKEVKVSNELAEFLERESLLVDWGEDEYWEIGSGFKDQVPP
jgi:uncharacterized Fe-S cluster-containing MiaB family protein